MVDLLKKEKDLRKVEVINIEENDPEDIINEHEEKTKDDNIHQGEKGKQGLDAVQHGKDDNSIESKEHIEPGVDVNAEDYSDDDDENDSFEMLLDGSDNELTSASDNDCEPKSEVSDVAYCQSLVSFYLISDIFFVHLHSDLKQNYTLIFLHIHCLNLFLSCMHYVISGTIDIVKFQTFSLFFYCLLSYFLLYLSNLVIAIPSVQFGRDVLVQ